MQEQRKILIVLARENFRDEEYEITKEHLVKSGFNLKTVSDQRGEAIGKFGQRVKIDSAFSEINLQDYEALVIIGGPGIYNYFENNELLNLVRDFNREGKLLAAICSAPVVLANAGVLQGKKATAFSGEKEKLQAKGAVYTGKSVEVDDSIITATGPEAAAPFAEKIIEVLG